MLSTILQSQDSGMVKRIRGTACSLRVSPAISNRLVESAKGVLLKFLPDIYIHTDASRGASSGKSPGDFEFFNLICLIQTIKILLTWRRVAQGQYHIL